MLRAFRQSSASDPIVLGSHRKPEAVLLPFVQYKNLTSSTPASESTLDRLTACRALIQRLADLNNVGKISVFGSVSRGTETAESDVDLLIEPRPSTSLFDLAQLEIDLEQLLGRTVDIISRNALDPKRDAEILAEAISL